MIGAPGARATWPRWVAGLEQGLCIALSVFQLWAIYVGTVNPQLHRALFLGLSLTLIFLADAAARPAARGAGRLAAATAWALAVLSLLSAGYYLWRFDWIAYRWPLVDALGPLDLACGAVFVVAVLEASRRLVGWALWSVVAVFLVYALAGHLTTGLFYHRPLGLDAILDQLVFTGNGLFGAPLAVAATYVFVFVLFGSALELSGAGEFFFNLASALTGRARGGPAKVAVVSSALYGTITGSPTSNVVTTGLFTIPMMKRVGFRSDFAAAVEAVASTGGSLLPPVMGSAAFLMSELTGISYFDIIVAATCPALLFYFGVFMQIHWASARLDLAATEAPARSAGAVLRADGFHLIPLVVLVALMVADYTPITAAGVALVLTVAASWVRRETRIGPAAAVRLLELGARRSLLVVAACAAAGAVVGGITMTGLGGKVTSLIFAHAGGSIFPALVATMGVCVLLGMGVPVPSAYILTAVLAGPPLLLLGLPMMSAHLFIVYFSVLSAITPPVAGGLCGRRHRGGKPDEGGAAGRASRAGGVRRPLLLRVPAGAAAARDAGRDRAGARDVGDGRVPAVGRAGGLHAAAPGAVGAGAGARRRAVPDLPGVADRPGRPAGRGHRHRPAVRSPPPRGGARRRDHRAVRAVVGARKGRALVARPRPVRLSFCPLLHHQVHAADREPVARPQGGLLHTLAVHEGSVRAGEVGDRQRPAGVDGQAAVHARNQRRVDDEVGAGRAADRPDGPGRQAEDVGAAGIGRAKCPHERSV